MKIFATALALLLSLFALPLTSHAQSTQISTEYLMTVYLPTERKAIDPTLTIVNILPGGWVKGPGITGKVIITSVGDTRGAALVISSGARRPRLSV